MGAVAKLCSHAILLDAGTIVDYGNADTVIGNYLTDFAVSQSHTAIAPPKLKKNVVIVSAELADAQMQPATLFAYHHPFHISFDFEVSEGVRVLCLWIRIVNQVGVFVAFCWLDYQTTYAPGYYRITGQIPANLLAPGKYFVDVGSEHFPIESYHNVHNCLSFEVLNTAPDFLPGPYGWGVTHLQLTGSVTNLSNKSNGSIAL